MIIGPYKAAQVWTNQRFALMYHHVHHTIQKKEPGFGIHDERFLFYTLLPKIRELGYKIYQDNNLCFLRARTDQTIWANDCFVTSPTENEAAKYKAIEVNRRIVEDIIFDKKNTNSDEATTQRCRLSWLNPSLRKSVVHLDCFGTHSQLPDDLLTHKQILL